MNTADAVAYLEVTAEEQPELMHMALAHVLEARPDLASVFIPKYAHLLQKDSLKQLAAKFRSARSYISRHREALTLMATEHGPLAIC